MFKNLNSNLKTLGLITIFYGVIITAIFSISYSAPISQNASGGGMTGGSDYIVITQNIGTWDMNASTTNTVGIVSPMSKDNIRMISILVYTDTEATLYDLTTYQGTPQQISGSISDVTDDGDGTISLVMDRLSSGFFDSTTFNDTAINRGFITIIRAK